MESYSTDCFFFFLGNRSLSQKFDEIERIGRGGLSDDCRDFEVE